MNVRAIALAVPLALGLACQTTSKQGSAGTATAPQPEPSDQQASGAPQPPDRQQPADQQQAGTGEQAGAAQQDLPSADPVIRPGPSIQGHAEDETVAGHIAEVSADELVIDTESGQARLQVVPETSIELDGMEASVEDLLEGQPVRASYDTVDGQEIAVKIRAGDMEEEEESDEAADVSTPADSGTGSSGTGSSSDTSGTGSSPGSTVDPKDMGAGGSDAAGSSGGSR